MAAGKRLISNPLHLNGFSSIICFILESFKNYGKHLKGSHEGPDILKQENSI